MKAQAPHRSKRYPYEEFVSWIHIEFYQARAIPVPNLDIDTPNSGIARDQTTTPNFYLARLDGALAPSSDRKGVSQGQNYVR